MRRIRSSDEVRRIPDARRHRSREADCRQGSFGSRVARRGTRAGGGSEPADQRHRARHPRLTDRRPQRSVRGRPLPHQGPRAGLRGPTHFGGVARVHVDGPPPSTPRSSSAGSTPGWSSSARPTPRSSGRRASPSRRCGVRRTIRGTCSGRRVDPRADRRPRSPRASCRARVRATVEGRSASRRRAAVWSASNRAGD